MEGLGLLYAYRKNRFSLLLWAPQNDIGTIAIDFLLIYLQHPHYDTTCLLQNGSVWRNSFAFMEFYCYSKANRCCSILIKNSTSRLPQVVMEFIIPLVCHTDPILHLLQTRYNRYWVSRFFQKNILLKMSQNKKNGVPTWYRTNS